MKNMVQNCIMCEHFRFDPGCGDYSELTPGEDWCASCAKNHWTLEGYNVYTDQWRKTILKAGDCPDFS